MVALYTIGKVYALPLGENWAPVVMITLASFLVVCVGYRRARERNRKARVAEADMDLERGGVILPIDQVDPGDRS
jgi:membrane protein implicated in regulation of membrane protease activity